MTQPDFARRIIRWQRSHGRHDLPWQQQPNPYSTWVSEIMLQQTQVAVVVDYFQRWMTRFPTVQALADAPMDTVLEHWAGLGYYARARNLHRAAQIVVTDYNAALPADAAALQSLPGIGRSTAGAILSLGFGQVAAILDGNVKRVLARHAGIEGWPGRSAVARRLWAEAEARLPNRDAAAYTQGLMDLGATLCNRSQPQCASCPVVGDCTAHQAGTQESIPAPKPRQAKRERRSLVLIAVHNGHVLLQRRPPDGIWGGLWAPPMIDLDGEANIDVVDAATAIGLRARKAPKSLATISHQLTHFRWQLQPVQLDVAPIGVQDDGGSRWQAIGHTDAAVPAPINTLLAQLARASSNEQATA